VSERQPDNSRRKLLRAAIGYASAVLVSRIASADSFVPLGPAAQQVLIGEDAITQGAHALLAR